MILKADFYRVKGLGLGGAVNRLEYGFPIDWEWEVDGDPTKCSYAIKETKGQLTGTAPPKNKKWESEGTSAFDRKGGGWAPLVGPAGVDPLGMIVDEAGKYVINKGTLQQTFRCIDSDDDWQHPTHPKDVPRTYSITESSATYDPKNPPTTK